MSFDLKKVREITVIVREIMTIITMIVSMILSALAVKEIGSYYDSRIEVLATDLQKTVDSFFIDLVQKEKPECFYDQHAQSYENMYGDLDELSKRAKAIPNNQKTIEQINLLLKNTIFLEYIDMEARQNKECIPINDLKRYHRDFTNRYNIIIENESLKRYIDERIQELRRR